MKSPALLLVALLTDVGRLQPCVKGLDRDKITIKRRVKKEGYGFLTIALPSLGDAITHGVASGRFALPKGFKRAPRSALPCIFSGLLSKVFDTSSGHLLENACHESLISLRQVCYLYKKVALESIDDDILHQKAVNDFVEVERSIDGNSFTADELYHIDRVTALVLPSLMGDSSSPIDIPVFAGIKEGKCKHGPGAVFEGYSPNQKWKGVSDEIRKDSFDTDLFGYDTFRDAHYMDSLYNGDLLDVTKGPLPSMQDGSSSIARLVTVAKNSTSRRTITIEPLMKQFLQQGLNTQLRDSIEKCGILSESLALTNQSLNQNLALIGSLTNEWSTIDLKSASDLLSLSIVEKVFSQKHSAFLNAMLSCRSSQIEYTTANKQKHILSVKKFAGMGNALTFPIQSVVFAILAIAAVLHDQGLRPDYRNAKRAARCVRVYGDDIIVKRIHSQTVVLWLTKAGLTVNFNKSFLDGLFKESCGVDAFGGTNVTPLYCRFRPDNSSTEPSDIARAVSFSNLLWERAYYHSANLIRDEVEDRLKKRLPLVSRSSGALGWISRQDAMDAHTWDPKHQRLVTRAITVISMFRKDPLDGLAALLKFFHVPLLGRAKDHLQKSSVRFQLRIARKRVPTEVGA